MSLGINELTEAPYEKPQHLSVKHPTICLHATDISQLPADFPQIKHIQ